MLILVTGGAASGKSAHAERLVCEAAPSSRLYLATMQPFGAAAQARIARHRALRQGKGFETIERPLGLQSLTLARQYDGMLLEDLGNLLANEMFAPEGAGDAAFGSILAGHCASARLLRNAGRGDGRNLFRWAGLPAPKPRGISATLRHSTARLPRGRDAVYESVCGILLPLKGEKNA